MNQQGSLFKNLETSDESLKGKFQYSLLLSAVGDSLGWYLEFKNKKPENTIENYKRWKKLVGGRWWGYEDEIKEGEYSDDTQLMLAISRSIKTNLSFDPNYFAYLELPLWLSYERGGGKTVKTAARSLLKKNTQWFSNIFKTKDISYISSGANGAAMRNLPIALIHNKDIESFFEDTFKNTIITHGHPRALIGALNIGYAQIFLLNKNSQSFNAKEFIDFILDNLAKSLNLLKEKINHIKCLNQWYTTLLKKYQYDYINEFNKFIKESYIFNRKILDFLNKEDIEFYNFTKALSPKYKGSGTSTVAVAIYMFLKYIENPEKIIIETSNFVGSDTDTISSFSGSLIGSFFGEEISKNKKLTDLIVHLQDRNYISNIGITLFDYFSNKLNIASKYIVDKKEALLKIMAWELGLHEMFWDALKEGDNIVHPTLGKGIILEKFMKPIKNRQDYIVKLVYIKFETGQTAYFHSRVSMDSKEVKDSLSKYIENVLS